MTANMGKFSVDRIARGLHYRIGRYIAKQDAAVQAQREKDSAPPAAPIPTKINVGCGQDKRLDSRRELPSED